MSYYPKIELEDEATIEEKLDAIINILNFVSKEMCVGRVPQNKTYLQDNIEQTKEELNTPLSIAFVKMAEKGDIDEITASEHIEMFLYWQDKHDYNIGDLRQFKGKLYKCLQAHTSQADWTPDVSTSLWKVCGINENGIPEWSQPISTSDAYMTGDEVMYDGVHYKSLVDNNVWSPADYPHGWEVVE